MSYMIIDGIKCEYENARNVLEVALANGINIPNLCYCESLSTYGGCRLCVVENERGGVEAACTMVPKDGMVVKTNTAKLREFRRGVIELLLDSHRSECTTCAKSGNCKLQEYAKRYGVEQSVKDGYCKEPVDNSSYSIVRDPSKCILCGKCVRVCSEIQNVKAIEFVNRGDEAFVSCGFEGMKLAETNCVGCGQCAAICPTGAITIKNNVSEVWKAIHDEGKKVAVQIAPAVRVGLAEEFGIPATQPIMGKIVSALRLLGVDYVFDAAQSAYQTVIEEADEFKARKKADKKALVLSSYCPAWVKHVECEHPELVKNLVTAGSPMEICAALVQQKFKGEDICSVAVMSCTAAKMEAQRPQLVKDGKKLVDVVLTTVELAAMIREHGMTFSALPDTPCDNFFAQVVGNKCATPLALRINPDKCIGCTKCARRCPVGAITGKVKEAHVIDTDKCIKCRICKLGCAKEAVEVVSNVNGLKVCAVNGLANADKLLEKIANGEESCDFIEVMACPNGCPGGGGQPEACVFAKPDKSVGTFDVDYVRPEENTKLESVSKILGGREKELLHVEY